MQNSHRRTGHGHTGKVRTGESRTGAGVAGDGVAGGGIAGADDAKMAGRAVDAEPSDAALLRPLPRRRHEGVRGVNGRRGGARGACGCRRQALSSNDAIVSAPRPQRVS